MTRTLVAVAVAAAFALAGSCTLITNFDPEGQPCDNAEADPSLKCLTDAGYHCDPTTLLCTKKGTAGTGGGDAGSDAGI
jgi:hypothetical protein